MNLLCRELSTYQSPTDKTNFLNTSNFKIETGTGLSKTVLQLAPYPNDTNAGKIR